MGFYDEAVHVLETIARALNGAFSYGSMADFYNRSPEKTPICPEFSKTAVRMKKHIRPPVRAEPERGRSNPKTKHINTFFKFKEDFIMSFFTTAVSTMSTLVVALGGGVGVWGVVNLMEGYGADNPASKSQGVKQLMAGGGIMLLGLKVVPLLSSLITV